MTHSNFGSDAPWQADLTLLIEAVMGMALLAGAVLARRRHYRAHAWCQSAVVLLNLVVIGFAMAPSFYIQLAPKIPQAIRKSYYAIAIGHAALGAVAELTGLRYSCSRHQRSSQALAPDELSGLDARNSHIVVGGPSAWRRDVRPLVRASIGRHTMWSC
jgi:Ca2+/H+ antiporter